MEPRLLDSNVLISVDLARSGDIEERANFTLRDHVIVIRTSGSRAGRLAGGVLHELADFFFEGHLPQEFVDFLLGAGAGEAGRDGARRTSLRRRGRRYG